MLIGSEQTVMDTVLIPQGPEKIPAEAHQALPCLTLCLCILFLLALPCHIDLLFNILCKVRVACIILQEHVSGPKSQQSLFVEFKCGLNLCITSLGCETQLYTVDRPSEYTEQCCISE